MHVAGDLGFPSLVLAVVFFVFPVIGFVIRRKWRLAAARKEEIKRLLVLVSEESARAELEATFSYGAAAVSESGNGYQGNGYYCAVCFCPTTTRCARCKAVRYCSGKCQIIHWRQGHKEECRPPSTTYCINDDESNPSHQKAAKNDEQVDEQSESAPSPLSSAERLLSDSSSSHGVQSFDAKVDSDAETEGTCSVAESLSTSFSGFSTSPTHGESPDDVSVGESISSTESEASDGLLSADVASNMLKSDLNEMDITKPLSPKFASLADTVDSFNKSSKLSQSEPENNDEGRLSASAGSSHQSIRPACGESVTKSSKASSGFWGRTLRSLVSSVDAQDDSLIKHSKGSSSLSSDSESSPNFKFNVSGTSAPSLHPQSSEGKGIILDDTVLTSMGTSKPVGASVSSEDSIVDAPKVKSFLSGSCKKSDHTDNKTGGDLNAAKSTEHKSVSSSQSRAPSPSATGGYTLSTDATMFYRSASTVPEKSNVVVNDSVGTLHVSKSRSSPNGSQTHLASHVHEHSAPSAKFGKDDSAKAGDVLSSQVASSQSGSVNGLKSSMRKVVDQLRGPKCGKYSDKGLFPYDLFVKLYTSNKVELQPCGLINCGNSCYANAVLQCLAFTPPLATYFVQGLHSKACINKEWCFTCEFENLILRAKEGKSPLSPIGILSQLRNIGSHLGNGREEDAHEFLRYAIEAMQSVCLKEAGATALGSFEEETTLIGLTFGGYLRSKIKCMQCQFKSERQEKMMDLTVEIEGDIGKLEDALKRFTATEILDGDNKYQCGRCKSYEKAKKKLTILEAPNILTVALKRFQSGKFGKLNKSIRFPEILDLAPYMSGTSDKAPIYRLYGVVVHLDVMNAAFSGHYVCYVKNNQNKWFKIDDSLVTPVELERVLTKGAYMLLYARCSPRAPRFLRNRTVPLDPKRKGTPSKVSGKNNSSSSRSTSSGPSAIQVPIESIPPDRMASVESFYMKFHKLQKILEEDSSSDSFSFTSSNSDEGSCSTDSTRDSTSTDELSDYIFGGWNSWRKTSDFDSSSSSSSSPSYMRHSPLADDKSQTDYAHSTLDDSDLWDGLPRRRSRPVDVEGKGADPFLHSDMVRQCRNLVSSSSCRETNPVKLGSDDPFSNVKLGIPFRRSVSERTE